MFKRPSIRKKERTREINLNLVPILDALVTLTAFLLFSSSFLALVVIDSPVPLVSSAQVQLEKIKDKPLQLTVHIQENQIIISDWSGSREHHVIRNIQDPTTQESRYDLEKFHVLLVEIKQRYPHETKLILKPISGVAYEVLVDIMDAARELSNTDPPLYQKTAQGEQVPETKLFPEIIFGNIMT